MREIEPAIEQTLEKRIYAERDAILFALGEGLYGFCFGTRPLTWNGITFHGAGNLIELSAVKTSGDGSPTEMTAALSAIRGTDLTPDVLGQIENYTYHLREVLVYRFLFDLDTGERIGAMPLILFRGYVDGMQHSHEPDGPYKLICNMKSKSVDYRKTGYRKRGNETQKAMNGGSTDKFFEHAAQTKSVQVDWGPQ
ncbi:hypothetical protein [Roseibium sp. RKSG952]|uniref:hypothetical protein n=1 Tax=Roseibium sp. RKSG952 TaxID=2529384 RepID=UPI0012BC0BF6|nr:hypothetical protein [Roseibium sp. RKSG952]MTH96428.1 hypothetical protein [Roseibium sp. RKSG952]